MEGGGEDMVAVIDGIHRGPNGLTVTVIPDIHGREKRNTTNHAANTTVASKPSAHTSTETRCRSKPYPRTEQSFAGSSVLNSASYRRPFTASPSLAMSPDMVYFAESLRKYPDAKSESRSGELMKGRARESKIGKRRPLSNKPVRKTASQQAYKWMEWIDIGEGRRMNTPRDYYSALTDLDVDISPNAPVNTTYDYLGTSIKNPEVRYFSEMKNFCKQIKNCVTKPRHKICPKAQDRYDLHKLCHHNKDVTEKMCSNLQQRYELHKMRHHNKDLKKRLPCVCKTKNIQASLPPLKPPAFRIISEDVVKVSGKVCYCSSSSEVHQQNRVDSRRRNSEKVKNFRNNYQGNTNKLIRMIQKWIDSIAGNDNDNPIDKDVRMKLITKLAESLNRLSNEEDFIQKAEKEILKFLQGLSLLQNIPTTSQSNLDQLVEDLLNNLTNERNFHQETVSKLVDDLPINHNRLEEAKEIMNNFLKRNMNIDYDNVADRQQLKSNVIDLLQQLPLNCNKSYETLNKLADNFLEKFINNVQNLRELDDNNNNYKNEIVHGSEKNMNRVMSWFQSIPYLGAFDKENMNNIEILCNKLNELRDKKSINVLDEMKQEILKWLHSILTLNGLSLDESIQETLANDLISKLTSIPLQKMQESNVNNSLFNDVLSWFERIPNVDPKLNKKEAVESLVRNLNNIKEKDHEQMLIKHDNEIKKWLENLQKTHGINIDETDKKELERKIFMRVPETLQDKHKVTDRKEWEQMVHNKIDESLIDYEDILQPSYKENYDNNVRKCNIRPHKLGETIDTLQTIDSNDIAKVNRESSADKQNLYKHITKGKTDQYNKETVRNTDNVITSTPKTSTYNRFPGTGFASSIHYDNDSQSKVNDHNKKLTQLKHKIKEWFKDNNINIDEDQKENIVKTIAEDLLQRQKYLQTVNSATDLPDADYMKYVIFRELQGVIQQGHLDKVMSNVDKLQEMLNHISPSMSLDETKTEDIKKIRTECKDPKCYLLHDFIMKELNELKENLERYLTNNMLKPKADFHDNDINKSLIKETSIINKLPREISTLKNIKTRIEELVDNTFSNVPVKNKDSATAIWLNEIVQILNLIVKLIDKHMDSLQEQISDVAAAIKNMCNSYLPLFFFNLNNKRKERILNNGVLYDIIRNWCESLPFDDNINGNNNIEQLKKVIMIDKLMDIILNLYKDGLLFADGDLNEKLISDEIDHVLTFILSKEKNQHDLYQFKKALIGQLKKYKSNILDELNNYTYKQNLKDVISQNLPITENSSIGNETPFEVLKDNLAEAFTKLNSFNKISERERENYKEMLSNEINNFCNAYLKRFSISDINTTYLHSKLYNALKNVPKPNQENYQEKYDSLKHNRQKLFHEIPFDSNKVTENKIEKIASILAKRFKDLYKEEELNVFKTYDEIREFIVNWLQSLPLNLSDLNNPDLVDRLFSKLKNIITKRPLPIPPQTPVKGKRKENDLRAVNNRRLRPSSDVIRDKATLEKARTQSPKKFLNQKREYDRPNIKEHQISTDDILSTAKRASRSSLNRVSNDRIGSPKIVINDYFWNSSESKQSLEISMPKRNYSTPNYQKTKPSHTKNVDPKYQSNELLQKILDDEIGKFCDHYLKSHPESPLNKTELHSKLMDALKNALESQDVYQIKRVSFESEIRRLLEEFLDSNNLTKSEIDNAAALITKHFDDLYEENKLYFPKSYDKMKELILTWLQNVLLTFDKLSNKQDLVERIRSKLKKLSLSNQLGSPNKDTIFENNTMLDPQYGEYSDHNEKLELSGDMLTKEDKVTLERVKNRASKKLANTMSKKSPAAKSNLISIETQTSIKLTSGSASTVNSNITQNISIISHRKEDAPNRAKSITPKHRTKDIARPFDIKDDSNFDKCVKCPNLFKGRRPCNASDKFIPITANENKVCNCKGRMLTKCRADRHHKRRHWSQLNHRSQCLCGRCPFPCSLYFNREY